MEQIKFFNLQKNNKKSDTQPDYRISFKTEDSFVEAGACWIKKDSKGGSYLSCKLGDKWVDHTDKTKTRKGWHIEEDTPENASIEPETVSSSDDVGF